MFYNAQGKTVAVDGVEMDYVVFGKGIMPLIILPGLGDGLHTVAGQAKTMALYYKLFAQHFKVYVFSRKRELEEGYSTREMAKDQITALAALGINNFYLMGVSQGGMVAQYIAIDYPEKVNKLIIAVSISRSNENFCNVVSNWIKLAENEDYKSIMIDTAKKTYTPQKLKSYRYLYPIISRIGKPKEFTRFLIQATACLNHNSYGELNKIVCPTLVMGGGIDLVVGKEAAGEMAEQISNSRVLLYEELGHAAYEESKEFNQKVIDFLMSSEKGKNTIEKETM